MHYTRIIFYLLFNIKIIPSLPCLYFSVWELVYWLWGCFWNILWWPLGLQSPLKQRLGIEIASKFWSDQGNGVLLKEKIKHIYVVNLFEWTFIPCTFLFMVNYFSNVTFSYVVFCVIIYIEDVAVLSSSCNSWPGAAWLYLQSRRSKAKDKSCTWRNKDQTNVFVRTRRYNEEDTIWQ